MRFVHVLIFLLTVVLPSACKTVAESAVDLRWSSGDRLPAAPEMSHQPGLAGAVIGVVFGITIAVMRLSSNPVLAGVAWLFTWFFFVDWRCTASTASTARARF